MVKASGCMIIMPKGICCFENFSKIELLYAGILQTKIYTIFLRVLNTIIVFEKLRNKIVKEKMLLAKFTMQIKNKKIEIVSINCQNLNSLTKGKVVLHKKKKRENLYIYI